MRKILLAYYLFMIAVFSSTSQLLDRDTATWFQTPVYSFPADTTPFVLESEFYDFYNFSTEPDFLIRKSAHILVYAILSILIYINLKNLTLFIRVMLSWFFATCVGFLDELNRYFIIGRDGRLLDALLDSTASLLTIIAIVLINGIYTIFSAVKDEITKDI